MIKSLLFKQIINFQAMLLLREMWVFKMNRAWNFNRNFDISFVSVGFYLLTVFPSLWSLISSWIQWSEKMLRKCCFVYFSGGEIKKSGKQTQNKFLVSKDRFTYRKIFESKIFECYFPGINFLFWKMLKILD